MDVPVLRENVPRCIAEHFMSLSVLQLGVLRYSHYLLVPSLLFSLSLAFMSSFFLLSPLVLDCSPTFLPVLLFSLESVYPHVFPRSDRDSFGFPTLSLTFGLNVARHSLYAWIPLLRRSIAFPRISPHPCSLHRISFFLRCCVSQRSS